MNVPIHSRQRHGQECDRGAEKGTAEAAEHIGQLADLGGADDAAEAGFIVAYHHVADERGRHEHEEQRHDQLDLRDRGRRVGVDVAAAAEADRFRRRRPESQQEEHDGRDPEHRVAYLVAQLEARDCVEHPAIPYAALRAAPRRARVRVDEIDVFQVALDQREAVAGILLREDVNDSATREQSSRDHFIRRLHIFQRVVRDRLRPDGAAAARDQFARRAFELNTSARQDGHARTQVGDVLDDMGGQDDHHVLADLHQQVVETIAFLGIEAGGRLVHDHQLRIADQRLGDAEALAHAAGEAGDRLGAHRPQIGLHQQCFHGGTAIGGGANSRAEITRADVREHPVERSRAGRASDPAPPAVGQ